MEKYTYCIKSISGKKLGNAAQQSAEDAEDGLLTNHWRRLALITRLRRKQKQEGRRNVTTFGNTHWQLGLLLRLDMPAQWLVPAPGPHNWGFCPARSWTWVVELLPCSHVGPLPSCFLPANIIIIMNRDYQFSLEWWCLPKTSLIMFLWLVHKSYLFFFFSFCLEINCLLLSVWSPSPQGHETRLRASKSRIGPLTALKTKKKKKKPTSVNFGIFF